MSIALVGGMSRLERHYIAEARRLGVRLRVFNDAEVNIVDKLKQFDAIVIFTDKVSHRIRNEAANLAKLNGIPLHMYHSCGVCTLRRCLTCLTGGAIAGAEGGVDA